MENATFKCLALSPVKVKLKKLTPDFTKLKLTFHPCTNENAIALYEKKERSNEALFLDRLRTLFIHLNLIRYLFKTVSKEREADYYATFFSTRFLHLEPFYSEVIPFLYILHFRLVL